MDPKVDVDPEFAQLLLLLAEACGARLSETRIRTYALLLQDVGVEALRKAVYRCARERDQRYLPADPDLRLPTVAEIRTFVAPSEGDAALIAWSALAQAASSIGAYASLELEDTCAAEALLQVFGSWPAYCGTENGPTMATKRQEFLAVYREVRRRGATMPVGWMQGLCEQSGGARRPLPGTWVGRISARGVVMAVPVRELLQASGGKRLET
jgi:hypothetical protein